MTQQIDETFGHQHPTLSIVTVCYNSTATLERTIKSVAAQKDRETFVEYLVIDGGSDDGTVALIKKWHEKGVVDRFISEKDNGIYNAMNKAIHLAAGRYTVFLNSDDELASGALACCQEAAKKAPAYFYGNARVESADGTLSRWNGNSNRIPIYGISCHQALWVRTEILKQLGGFDENVGLSADYDLMWRLFLQHGPGLRINKDFAVYYLGGASFSKKSLISTYDTKLRYIDDTRKLLGKDENLVNELRLDWLGSIAGLARADPRMKAIQKQLVILGRELVLPHCRSIVTSLLDRISLLLIRIDSSIFNPALYFISKLGYLRLRKAITEGFD